MDQRLEINAVGSDSYYNDLLYNMIYMIYCVNILSQHYVIAM